MKNVTRATLEKWLEANRPDLKAHETNGNKGVFKAIVGPAFSFTTRGKTWKQVLESLKDGN